MKRSTHGGIVRGSTPSLLVWREFSGNSGESFFKTNRESNPKSIDRLLGIRWLPFVGGESAYPLSVADESHVVLNTFGFEEGFINNLLGTAADAVRHRLVVLDSRDDGVEAIDVPQNVLIAQELAAPANIEPAFRVLRGIDTSSSGRDENVAVFIKLSPLQYLGFIPIPGSLIRYGQGDGTNDYLFVWVAGPRLHASTVNVNTQGDFSATLSGNELIVPFDLEDDTDWDLSANRWFWIRTGENRLRSVSTSGTAGFEADLLDTYRIRAEVPCERLVSWSEDGLVRYWELRSNSISLISAYRFSPDLDRGICLERLDSKHTGDPE